MTIGEKFLTFYERKRKGDLGEWERKGKGKGIRDLMRESKTLRVTGTSAKETHLENAKTAILKFKCLA